MVDMSTAEAAAVEALPGLVMSASRRLLLLLARLLALLLLLLLTGLPSLGLPLDGLLPLPDLAT